MKFKEMMDSKKGIGSTVHVTVYNDNFAASAPQRGGNKTKRYTGTLYCYNKREDVMTILVPKGKGYRVVQASPSEVKIAKRQTMVPFKKGEYVV